MSARAMSCLLAAAVISGCASSENSAGPCNPADPLSCGTGGFCKDGACIKCKRGEYNCDLDHGTECEAQFPCQSTGDPCDVNVANSCNSVSQFCTLGVTGSGHCQICGSRYNCNGDNGDRCESTSPCSVMSNCVDAQKNSCGRQDLYCQSGRCLECRTGTFNCNGVNNDLCEVRAESCSEGVSCDEAEDNSCGHIAQICVGTTCERCTPVGMFNCNGRNDDGCEEASCTTATDCIVDNPDSCGDEDRYCNGGQCTECPPDKKNCNGLNGDRCEATACECEVNIWDSCGTEDKYCVDGSCVDCTGVSKNCNREDFDACEENSGDCNKKECVGPDHYEAADGSCKQCDTGTYNCSSMDPGCECDGAGCDDFYGCLQDCPDTQYRTYENSCAPCQPDGWLDCDDGAGCECDGTQNGYCNNGACLYWT